MPPKKDIPNTEAERVVELVEVPKIRYEDITLLLKTANDNQWLFSKSDCNFYVVEAAFKHFAGTFNNEANGMLISYSSTYVPIYLAGIPLILVRHPITRDNLSMGISHERYRKYMVIEGGMVQIHRINFP